MKRTNSYYNAGPGLDVQSSLPGEFRSAAEAVLTWHMMDNVTSKLEELNPVLLHTFRGNGDFLIRYTSSLLAMHSPIFIFRNRNENRNDLSLYEIIRHWCEFKVVTRAVISCLERNAVFRNKSLQFGRQKIQFLIVQESWPGSCN